MLWSLTLDRYKRYLFRDSLGGLASGLLVTRIGSAPVMLVVNGTALTLVALYFLFPSQGLEDGVLETGRTL